LAILTGNGTLGSGFVTGDTLSVYNNGTGNITIAAPGGITLRLAGTETVGQRTIPRRGLATLIFVSSTEVVITGSGIN
jgi:hypothetical protein